MKIARSMNKAQFVRSCGILFCFLITMSYIVSAAPPYNDYNNIRDLYELIMEKELLADAYGQPQHRLVRKSSRSPSLRLRFGRRSDPSINQDNGNEEHRYRSLPDIVSSENN